MKIAHVITGLNNGGAESVLYRLCSFDDNSGHEHVVISMMDHGKYGPLLQARGIKVYSLGFIRGRFSLKGFIKLIKILKKENPHVVQTWMYHADLIGSIAAKIAFCKKVVWNIRHNNLSIRDSGFSTCFIAFILSILSWFLPSGIICCAQKSIKTHKNIGYCARKMVLVSNGYDLERFGPDFKARVDLKSELLLDDSVPIMGMVARYDKLKDHDNLLNALSLLKQKNINFIFVLVGTNMDANNSILIKKIKDLSLMDCIRLLGQRSDIERVMNVLDFHVLSSSSEAFPNVVAEAMACGTPCIVTDVGDAAEIVGDTGMVVPPRDSYALADAMARFLDEIEMHPTWKKRKETARTRITEIYSIGTMVDKYHAVWSGI